MRIPFFMVLATLCACGNNGAPPYPAESNPATPFATKGVPSPSATVDGSPAGTQSTAMTASTTAPSARALAGAPATDPRVMYELREKCGEDALLWYRRFHADGTQAASTANHGFTSHYNVRTNACLAVTRSVNGHQEERKLTDVLENRDIGTLIYQSDSAAAPECHVAEQVCKSAQEWAALTAPYMND
jgi:hypothetical protein